MDRLYCLVYQLLSEDNKFPENRYWDEEDYHERMQYDHDQRHGAGAIDYQSQRVMVPSATLDFQPVKYLSQELPKLLNIWTVMDSYSRWSTGQTIFSTQLQCRSPRRYDMVL